MKLLIDTCICTVLCRILKECKGLHILSSRYKHRSLCRVDLPWGQVGLISNINFLKMKFLKNCILKVKEKVNSAQFRPLPQKIHPACPRKGSTLFRSVNLCIFVKFLHNTSATSFLHIYLQCCIFLTWSQVFFFVRQS